MCDQRITKIFSRFFDLIHKMPRRKFCRIFFLCLFCLYLGGAIYFYSQAEVKPPETLVMMYEPEVEEKRKINEIEIEYDEKFIKRELHIHAIPNQSQKELPTSLSKNSRQNHLQREQRLKHNEKIDRNSAIRLGVTNIINKVKLLKQRLSNRNSQSANKNISIFKNIRRKSAELVKIPRQTSIDIENKKKQLTERKTGVISKSSAKNGVDPNSNRAIVHKNGIVSPQKQKSKQSGYEQNELLTFRSKTQQNSILPFRIKTQQMDFKRILPTVYLYSAYLDTRNEKSSVRMVMISKANKKIAVNIWCHFTLKNNIHKKIPSKVVFYETCENHAKTYSAYIASCEIPGSDFNASSIWLSYSSKDFNKSEYKQAINVISKFPEKSRQEKFAVCVPPLFGEIDPMRLVEFIEYSRILGAEHFTFYLHNIEGEIKQLLQYYDLLDIVTFLPWSLPVIDDDIWYHGQSASVWDCLYRNMYYFKHVAFLDFDEFLIPQHQNTWEDLLTEIQKQDRINDDDIAAYRFLSAFFDPTFPENDNSDLSDEEKELMTVNLTTRTKTFSKIRTKMLVDPEKIFELGIHHVSKPFKEHYRVHNVGTGLAYIHHYRVCDNNWGMNCEQLIKDTSARRYKETLLNFTKWRLNRIQKFSDINKL